MNATDDEVEREHDLHSLEIDYLLLVVIEKIPKCLLSQDTAFGFVS